jgi:hypothetical protein
MSIFRQNTYFKIYVHCKPCPMFYSPEKKSLSKKQNPLPTLSIASHVYTSCRHLGRSVYVCEDQSNFKSKYKKHAVYTSIAFYYLHLSMRLKIWRRRLFRKLSEPFYSGLVCRGVLLRFLCNGECLSYFQHASISAHSEVNQSFK